MKPLILLCLAALFAVQGAPLAQSASEGARPEAGRAGLYKLSDMRVVLRDGRRVSPAERRTEPVCLPAAPPEEDLRLLERLELPGCRIGPVGQIQPTAAAALTEAALRANDPRHLRALYSVSRSVNCADGRDGGLVLLSAPGRTVLTLGLSAPDGTQESRTLSALFEAQDCPQALASTGE
ncbi:MAG: hypothetical protein WBG08_11560 [Litorimonas sp.]